MRLSKANLILALFTLLSYSKANQTTEFNCNYDANPTADFKVGTVTKGKEVLMCVHMLNYKVKMAFKLEVDVHTIVTGKHIYDLTSTGAVDFVVQFNGSEQFSQQIPYFRKEQSTVYPIHSMLIKTEAGVIKTVELEDISEGCASSNEVAEIQNFGYSFGSENKIPICKREVCQNNDDGLCDLKIFVSWIGTDASGNTMISNSERIVNFKKYNLPAMYTSISELNNNLGDTTKDKLDYSKIPSDVQARLSAIQS